MEQVALTAATTSTRLQVLPRQTCGLYTHTIFRRKYPGGFGKLLASIHGGELFESIVHNPVNIFMTHMSNYANDRLALFTFTKLFEFVQANTNLRLRYAPSAPADWQALEPVAGLQEPADPLGPNNLANYYFALNPSEREPLWTVSHSCLWQTFNCSHYLVASI